jgi:RNA polymerase sigma factor (sigma-70 family)
MDGSPSDEDESLLACKIANGDPDALRIFLRKYGGRVRGWLQKHYGTVLQECELREAYNSAFRKVWHNARKFDSSRGSMGGWFLRIAQREAQTINKRETTFHIRHSTLDPDMVTPDVCSTNDDSEQEDNNADKRVEDLRQAIDNLPPVQRSIILADLAADGPADAERLAAKLGTSKNSIYVSRNKAHETIRKVMQQQGYYQPFPERTS